MELLTHFEGQIACERKWKKISYPYYFLPDFNHEGIEMYVLNAALNIYNLNLILKHNIG